MKAQEKFVFALIFLFGSIGLPRTDAAAQQANLPPEVIAYANTVLYNGNVLTADQNFTVAKAVAVRDGKFMAVGETDRIVRMAGPNTRRIDLKGKTVIPGIIDLHQHPFTDGFLSYWAEKWLPNEPEWTNAQQAIDGIKRAVARAKPGEVVHIPRIYIGPGIEEQGGRIGTAVCDFMSVEEKFKSTLPCAARNSGNMCRVLTREQIDSVSPNNPVIFVAIVNLGPFAINSKAAEVIKPYMRGNTQIFEEEGNPCVVGGNMVRGADREVQEDLFSARHLIKDYLIFWSEPLENQLEAYRMASRGVSSAGITLTKEHTAMPLMAGIRELWARGELTVRMRMPYPITPLTADGNEVQIQPDLAETLFRRIGNMSGVGDDMLRFVGIRPNAVGGNLLSGGAWTLEPKMRSYSPPEGGMSSQYGGGGPGEGMYGPVGPGDEIFNSRAATVQAVRFGWDVSADHAVGDRAVREVVNAYEEGLKTQVVKVPGQRLTMNHTPMASLEDIQRMKELGIKASIGPWHVYMSDMLDAGVSQFGIERFSDMAAPMKSYINSGLRPALEGDIAGAIFWRFEKAITRKDDKYKRVWNPKEAVTRKEALWMATVYGAEHIGEQDRLGSIEVGKLADLVVVDRDYMSVPDDDISEIQTLFTMVGGKVVYEESGAF